MTETGRIAAPGVVGQRDDEIVVEHHDPPGTDEEAGTRSVVRLATLGPDGPTGTLSDELGQLN